MLGLIIVTLLGGLLVLALLSPLESLRWWSRDGHEVSTLLSGMTSQDLIAAGQRAGHAAADGPQQYVVYLSGVGAIGGSAESNSKTERHFLNALESRLDRASVTGDVFPYSVQNLGLPQRRGGGIWERASRGSGRKKGISLLPWIINLRNVFQVLVAADPRYGPTYGLGLAQVIWKSARARGYVLGSGATITILGYSGGAQMALNAAWFLEGVGIPMQIVSMGGVFENHSSFERIRRFIHLYGEKDSLMFIGRTFSPGRWKRSVNSEYNQAKSEGRVVEMCIGPMSHDAKKWYLDHKTFAADGRSYFDITVDAVVEFLQETPPPTAIPS
ncbi:MAG: hypothetical protein L0G23_09140 [Ruaniaceae bacterium]|nr:hypothetical protein [Ruaniaceae bacterium]